jgi:ABC-type transporter Mla MlaB component
MKRDELDRLTKEQLIELILAQFEQLKQLTQVQVDLAQLKADKETLKMKI